MCEAFRVKEDGACILRNAGRLVKGYPRLE